VDQPAATLWYHPHPHGQTARHVYRGLAGLFIVDDPDAVTDLPGRYGVDDIPVIVQDRRLDDDNQLVEDHPPMSTVGIIGDVVLVNGTMSPYHEVTTEQVRLRLLNGSNARVYRFGFSDDRSFALVGTDGGLLAAPQATSRIQLSPGERAEVVVAVQPGERAVLRSYPPDLGVNFWDRRFSGGDDTLDILELRAAQQLAPSVPVPERLADVSRLAGVDAPVDRTFELSGFEINGRSMDMQRIDFAVHRDTTEVWEVVAVDGVPHNFHVHDVQFQILSVAGSAPPPELNGWKDTVYTPPRVPVRLALRFRDHADPLNPYMFHCHVLYHEDNGLMGQFTVVEPGEEPPASLDGHDHRG
jgi:FtsP/CotA-like multicopper oxidase with cupredoxin domain